MLRPTTTANLFALTAGPLPPNPPALLARKQLGTLLAELAAQFEWVLVDSPPLASVTDALLLARHADHTVLVVQHDKVDKKLVKRSVLALRKVTPNLLGRRAQRGRRARPQLPVLLLPAPRGAGRARAQAAASQGRARAADRRDGGGTPG